MQGYAGNTALMIATRNGHKYIVDMLLAHNCNMDLQDDDGNTALMLAINAGHNDIIDALIRHKCNLDMHNFAGWTALMCAANKGDKDVVEKLIRHKCNMKLHNYNGKTALMISKDKNHVEIVAFIENQLRRNLSWDRRKALMLVLATGRVRVRRRVVQTPVIKQRVDDAALTTSSEKVLCDTFLLQHIMSYI